MPCVRFRGGICVACRVTPNLDMSEIPAVIYAAKSTGQNDEESTGAQVGACRAAVEREVGRSLCCEPFAEEGVSGYKGNRGIELQSAIRAATDAAVKHGNAELWVWRSNRLARGKGDRPDRRALGKLFYDLREVG